MTVKINIKNFINFIFSLFLILSCNSVIYYNNDYIKYTFLIVFIVFFITNFINKRISKNSIVIVIIYYVLTIFYGIFNGFSLMYIYTYLCILPLLYLIYYNNESSLGKSIITNILNIGTFLAILSLIVYFLGPVLGIIKPSATILNKWTSTENVENYIDSYYNLHYYTQYIFINGIEFVRNTGIFTEAPMFSLVLSTAIAIELFIEEKKSIFKTIILIFTLLTTFSTTGIIICLLMFLLKYFLNNKNKYLNAMKVLIFPIFLLFIVYIGIFFMKDKMSTSSYSIRIDDYIACFKAWKDNPIFGNGLFDSSAIVKYMSSFRISNQGLSNSLFVLLAQGGIYFLMIYLIPIFISIKQSLKYNINILSFIIIMFILFMTTIFLFTPFCLNFIAMAMCINNFKYGSKLNKM